MADAGRQCKPVLLGVALLIAGALQAPAPEPALATSTKVFDGLLAYVHNGDIYTIRPDGSSRRRLTRVGTAADPAWSADGTHIAYTVGHDWSGGDGDLWSMSADGTGRTRLVGGPADDVEPTWSPDDTQIAFIRAGVGVTVLTLQTGAVQTLLPASDGVSFTSPAWSPDGNRIAVVRKTCNDWGCGNGLVTVKVDDPAEPAQFVTGPAIEPDWSPDGTRIVYQDWSEDDRDPCGGVAVVVRADGAERQFLDMGECAGGSSPAWSPTGRRIALVSSGPLLTGDIGDRYGFDHGGIWIARPDGTGRRLVTRDGHSPDWQPVSTALPRRPKATPGNGGAGRIVFSSATGDGLDIFTVSVDGSRQRRLTRNGVSAEPAWSPNGQRILFRSHVFARGTWVGGIWVMRRDGMWQRPVVIGSGSHPSWAPDGERFVYEANGGLRVYKFRSVRPHWIFRKNTVNYCAAAPDWSPRGDWIVFVWSVGIRQCDLFKIRPDGSNLTRLTSSKGSETEPTWSPGSSRIAFTYRTYVRRPYRHSEAVFTLNGDGTDRRRVMDLPGLDSGPTWAPGSRRLALYSEGPDRYGPTSKPGIWAVAQNGSTPRLVIGDRASGQPDWWAPPSTPTR